jgi:hypothetical protein
VAVAFARSVTVDARHALLTFAVTLAGGTRYLMVPIARDGGGGLVVDELPSFAAPPRVASIAAAESASVPARERDALQAIAERFLRAYVGGDAGGLNYLVPAGTRIATPGPGAFELVELISLGLAGALGGSASSRPWRGCASSRRARSSGSGIGCGSSGATAGTSRMSTARGRAERCMLVRVGGSSP